MEISKIICTFAPLKQVQLKIQPNATKPMLVYGQNWACPALLPLHPSQVCLGKIKGPSPGRSSSRISRSTEAPHLSSGRSKQNLPITRAALSCPFSAYLGSWSFMPRNPDFHYTKPSFSCHETFIFPWPCYISNYRCIKCKHNSILTHKHTNSQTHKLTNTIFQ